MTSVGKWKIATYILALTTVVSLYRGHGDGTSSAATIKPAKRDAAYNKRLSSLARLRIPASLAGIDERQLLEDLVAANSTQQINLICERLGIFGTDMSLEPLEALTGRHPQSAGSAIMAMGGIGSDKATDQLIAMVGTGHSNRSYWAVRALAKTKNPRAEAQILDWAEGGNRRVQLAAVEALGQIDDPSAFEVLQRIAATGDTEILHSVIAGAGAMGSPEAVALLQEIADKGNRQLKSAALRNLPTQLTGEQQEWLMNVLATSDQQTAAAAAEALGRARVSDALPLLLDAARSGAPALRSGAVRALSSIGGEEAIAAIEELFIGAGQYTAYDIGRALLDSGGDQGKAVFLKTMKDGHRMSSQLIPLLAELSGEEVEALRLDIARNGSARDKQAVLGQLVGSDSEEVLEIMLDLAENGPQMTRYGALDLLAKSSSPRARDMIMKMAQSGGQASLDALRLLGDRAGSDPEVESILVEALYSGNATKAQTASWALAGAGTQGATEALVSAVQSGDKRLANNAMNALGQLGGSPEVVDALREIATNSKDPQLKSSAMHQLVNSGAPEASSLVLDALRKGDAGADSLLYSMLQSGGGEADEAIALAAGSESASTRAALANALSSRMDDDSQVILDKLSRDEDFSVKSAAVYAMANVGSSESVDRLIDIASNGDAQLRGVALSAVGNSGDPRATTLIADAIQSGDSQLAQSAIYAAQNVGPEVNEALIVLAEDASADKYLRQQAVQALMNRGADVDGDQLARLQEETGAQDPYGFEGRGYYGGFDH